ncbi:MAG TPA: polysaccharide deacetylase family protein, partial [Candidatus Dormibacteraeota bacterium]|nr:polysaccharide deacetylase family protein [Candidatus Dormibacteraeota bacterium]
LRSAAIKTAAASPPRVVLKARTSQRLIALTFDLDMTPSMVDQVRAGTSWFNADAVAYLRAQQVHATFFMTGLWAEIYPSMARQLAQDPTFEIGNHSYSHPAFHLPCYRLGGVARSAQAQQVRMAQQAIIWATGVTPRYFRFPGGCYDRQALDLVQAAGLVPIEWDVNSIDAFNPHPKQISATVLSQVAPGSIVIMHLQAGANAPGTGAALRVIVPALQQRGYRFVTVSELLAAGSPVQPTDPKEIVEVYQAPLPTATPAPAPRPLAAAATRPRWCGWVPTRSGRVWVCR